MTVLLGLMECDETCTLSGLLHQVAVKGNVSSWWAEQQAKLARWWEEQRAAIERQVAQWLEDLQRQLEEAVQKQIEETLNQLCGAAFILPGGLALAAWWLRQRGHSG